MNRKQAVNATIAVLLVASVFSVVPVAADDVQKNEMSFDLTYYSDYYDADTIRNSGAVNYTQYKHVYGSSPYVYQSGTWVTAHKDNYQGSYSYTWAGSDKHRIIIEEDSGSAGSPVISNTRAYDDDDDDSSIDDEAIMYAFDLAWDVMKSTAPFYIPPRPPGMVPVSDSANDVNIEDVSDTKTIIHFNEGQTDSGEQLTEGATWSWEFQNGGTSGWYWVSADRRLQMGYYHMSNTGYIQFYDQEQFQMAMSTGFCLYRDDKTSTC